MSESKLITLLLCMTLAAGSAEACKHANTRNPMLPCGHRHPTAGQVQRHPVVRKVPARAVSRGSRCDVHAPCGHSVPGDIHARPEAQRSFIRRNAHWLWAGAGLVAGLVIENNIHDHSAATIVTTVVNTCTPRKHREQPPKKSKCRK